MNRLEERYRSVLRILPTSYREVWEEDMVAAFMESMETDDPESADYLADFGRPSRSEVVSVAVLAIRLRLGLSGYSPRSAAWGEATRILAVASLLAHAVFGALGLVQTLWLNGAFPWLAVPPELASAPRDLWHVTLNLVGLAAVGALFALLYGNQRLAKVLAAVVVLAYGLETVGSSVAAIGAGPPAFSFSAWSGLLVDAALLLALMAFNRETPPVRRGPWLIALGVGVLIVPGPWLLIPLPQNLVTLMDAAGMYAVAVIIAGVAHLAGRAFGRGLPGGGASWSLALALLAITVLGLRCVTFLDYSSLSTQSWPPMSVMLAEVAALLAIAAPLTVLAHRELRRLPAQLTYPPL